MHCVAPAADVLPSEQRAHFYCPCWGQTSLPGRGCRRWCPCRRKYRPDRGCKRRSPDCVAIGPAAHSRQRSAPASELVPGSQACTVQLQRAQRCRLGRLRRCQSRSGTGRLRSGQQSRKRCLLPRAGGRGMGCNWLRRSPRRRCRQDRVYMRCCPARLRRCPARTANRCCCRPWRTSRRRRACTAWRRRQRRYQPSNSRRYRYCRTDRQDSHRRSRCPLLTPVLPGMAYRWCWRKPTRRCSQGRAGRWCCRWTERCSWGARRARGAAG